VAVNLFLIGDNSAADHCKIGRNFYSTETSKLLCTWIDDSDRVLKAKRNIARQRRVVVKTAARDLKVRNEAIIPAFKENQSRANYILNFARPRQRDHEIYRCTPDCSIAATITSKLSRLW